MDMSEGQYITLSELDAELFACADILRGSVDSGKYKDYILPLVFYLSPRRESRRLRRE